MEPRVNPRSSASRLRGALACATLILLPALACAAAPTPAGSGNQAALQHRIETLQRTTQRLDLQRQIEVLRRTVQQLERRVQALETRPAPVAALPARPAAPAEHPAAPAAAAPAQPAGPRLTAQTKANWGALKHGMSTDQVRALLGPPTSEGEINPGQRLWYYTYPGPRSGSVLFSRAGVVSSWQRPPFGWLW